MAECPCQELIESCLGSPCDETLLLQHELALSQLALEHACSGLDLAQLEAVNQLWEQLVEVQSMGFLENELQCTHRVLELVALECLRLDLVDAMQNFLETVLQIVYTLPVNLLHLLALICQLRSVVTRDLLHRKRGLVDQSLDSQLEVLQLLLLLLGDA